MVQLNAAGLEPQVLPKGTPVFEEAVFVVKNTFVDHAESLTSDMRRRRASSVPPARSPTHETPEFSEAVKAWGPSSDSGSTACSDDVASLEDCEDPVLEALPTDVRADLVQAIEAVFRQRSMSVEGCELDMDDEEDEDRMVRATFSVLAEGDDRSPMGKQPLPPALVAELGPERLEQRNDSLRLALGGPFRRTLVDLVFICAKDDAAAC
jgi:hypothetical protein